MASKFKFMSFNTLTVIAFDNFTLQFQLLVEFILYRLLYSTHFRGRHKSTLPRAEPHHKHHQLNLPTWTICLLFLFLQSTYFLPLLLLLHCISRMLSRIYRKLCLHWEIVAFDGKIITS